MTARSGALTLVGQVERVSYHNPQNGYTVVRVRTGDGEITAVGHFEALNAGETVELTGEWTSHPKHGEQFRVQHATHSAPSSLDGLEKYLGSGVIKGIGPALAARIIAAFGNETLTVISEQPERLARVSGVGARRAQAIAESWRAQADLRDLMTFLHGHGLSSSHAVRIHKTYGDEALTVVRTEPYRLAAEVWGIGFATADKLAEHLGIARDAEMRLRAGLLEALRQASEDGHTGLPRVELFARAARLLVTDGANLEAVLATAAL
ncbi:MAG TPA: helix-hairpin-helix domain-containing protein, partial [Oscillatoriaceae cyanobacterium]